MRKLLLGTTALAAATAMSASALADVSIAGSYEFKYKSESSQVASKDGTTMGHGGNDLVLTFTNKTDSGLTLAYRYDISDMTTDGGAMTGDENSLSISGGFGKIVLGTDDDAADAYNIDEMDLPTEEPGAGTLASASIGTSSSVSSADDIKVAYHLPAMGGLTAGASFTNESAAGNADTTEFGMKYSMSAGGASITIGGGQATTENSTQDIDQQNLGLKVVSGNISAALSQGSYEASSQDETSTSAAISFKVSDVMTVGAFTTEVEDDSTSEELQVSGVELAYTIAPGLSAVINVEDYDYKVGTSSGNTADSGTTSRLAIKASF